MLSFWGYLCQGCIILCVLSIPAMSHTWKFRWIVESFVKITAFCYLWTNCNLVTAIWWVTRRVQDLTGDKYLINNLLPQKVWSQRDHRRHAKVCLFCLKCIDNQHILQKGRSVWIIMNQSIRSPIRSPVGLSKLGDRIRCLIEAVLI